ncbi:hypothetical protein CPC08DRAFT_768279 [Agrocybe pediades]|nr:hypothetical protein CPC08DRAFT_768279 [Agrocybe pediades]
MPPSRTREKSPDPPSKVLQDRLCASQLRCQNLTTFRKDATNGLLEIQFLALESGELLEARLLWSHHLNHDFPPIHCFHDTKAKIYTVSGQGPYSGLTFISCRHRRTCSFRINVDKIRANKNQGLLYKVYKHIGFDVTPAMWPLS